jgi:hypothetical protein
MIEITTMASYDATRAANPDAVIMFRIDADRYDLLFPDGHPVGKFVVRC